MRVVWDTNVLLSALLSPHGFPDTIYRALRAGRFEVVTSRVKLEELRRASRYPKLRALLPAHAVGTMVNNLHRAILLDRLLSVFEADDPDDAFLLAMASDGQADYLVTGDHRAGLLQRAKCGKTRILTPAAFCDGVLSELSDAVKMLKVCRRNHLASMLTRVSVAGPGAHFPGAPFSV